ncbi:hypothetical protein, partial [Salmonella enterica]|uniref:hypothetical protein n=1 Tax=Salmonella enterica TaxID=28901 RepID=UPI003075CD8F
PRHIITTTGGAIFNARLVHGVNIKFIARLKVCKYKSSLESSVSTIFSRNNGTSQQPQPTGIRPTDLLPQDMPVQDR